ncbi:MAG: hypothetical protein ABFD79_14675 [Phycisphaerales bacterium]
MDDYYDDSPKKPSVEELEIILEELDYTDVCAYTRNCQSAERDYLVLYSCITQALEIAKGDKVVVPREPTEEMLLAVVNNYMNESEDPRGAMCGAYKAMIAVAEGEK